MDNLFEFLETNSVDIKDDNINIQHPNDSWDNYLDMLNDMKAHAKVNEGAIVQEDRPMELKLAYRCTNTNKTWSCKITNIRKTADELIKNGESEKADLIFKANATEEGKNNLLAVINGK